MPNYNRTVYLEDVDQILETLFTQLRADIQESIQEKVNSWKTDDGFVIIRSFRNPWYVDEGHPCHVCGSISTSRQSHSIFTGAESFACFDCGTSSKTEIRCLHPEHIRVGGECPFLDEDGKRY